MTTPLGRTMRKLYGALAVCAGLLIIGRPARAQQLFIDTLWVEDGSFCSGPISGTFGIPPNTETITSQFLCDGPGEGVSQSNRPDQGNISNDPHIEFDQTVAPSCVGSAFPAGDTSNNVCNNRIFLCSRVGFNNNSSTATAFGIDTMQFELFKFGPGSNGLDPASTPPLRTFNISSPGQVPAFAAGTIPIDAECTGAGRQVGCGMCVIWDGSINIQGEFGKSDGQFGFRGTVQTNQVNGTVGNINISNTKEYPDNPGTTENSAGTIVASLPITMDVTNVHVVRTTPTVVGAITGVAAEPYNIVYQLSKDSTMFITIEDGTGASVVRGLVPGLPRVGEGIPFGSLQNGDAWNGRADNGDLVSPGNYLAVLQAVNTNQFGTDLSIPTTRQLALDPVQITDLQTTALGSASTATAVLTYTLTEPATVFIDIYPPGTQFCNGLTSVNNPAIVPDQADPLPPKNFAPVVGSCPGTVINPLRRIVQVTNFRTPTTAIWDGRDSAGVFQNDGNYVFVIYAALPSQNGFAFLANPADKRIWTSVAKSGFLSIARGLVGISQITPATTVIGSTQPVGGLNPIVFSYTLSRDAVVSVKIFDSASNLKRTLIDNQQRLGGFLNQEVWQDGADDNGNVLSSGTYLVQLTAADTFFPSKVSTTTAIFPLNLFRITDVSNTPLLTKSTDVITLNYLLSQGMNVAWNIYPPGTVIKSTTWPPCNALTPAPGCLQTLASDGVTPVSPIVVVNGMRPGRLRITETWDGRDPNTGLFEPDGTYVFTLIAQSTTTPTFFATDKVFGTLTIARGAVAFSVFNVSPTIPQLFNSNQTITLPPFDTQYTLTRQSSVTVQILNTAVPPKVVRTLIAGQVRDANVLNSDFWDARDDNGNFVPAGFYNVQVIAQDLASTLSSGSTAQQTIAVDPLRIYDVAVRPLVSSASAAISYQVSETMKVSIKIYKPGTSFAANGTPNPPENVSLVQRIVGVRPARTQITDAFDGRDLRISLLPDGDYVFRMIASTDSNSIDTVTGNPVPGASLAEDVIIDNVPVTRGQSLDPQGDFESNTFVYPNPIPRGAQATFNIFAPFQANVDVKIFTLTGQLVFERSFGNQGPSTTSPPITFTWNRVNNSGRGLAAGVYFMLVREEETLGGSNVLQTVKKILLQ